jgi:cell division protein ZapA
MPSVEIEIGSRRYQIACRAGEEEHLQAVAAIVDSKARDAAGALGSLGETRQLLIASLLLADQIHEQQNGAGSSAPAPAVAPGLVDDPASEAVAEALERLAERMESLAARLESGAPSP